MTINVNLDTSIEFLKKLVNINTGSYNQKGIQECVELLIEHFSTLNCVHEKIMRKDNKGTTHCTAITFSKYPKASKRCLLSIHLDTVFNPTSSFQIFKRLPNNQASGPGVIDAKGGIVILFNTLALLEQSKLNETLGWTVVISTDEEIGSPYSKELLTQLGPKHDFALVFEPALENGDIINQRPASSNITVTAKGKAAHAGRGATKGVNAIVHLLAFIQQLQAIIPLNSDTHTINIGTIQGGQRENIIPDNATACLNARFMADINLQSFLDQCQAIADHINKTTQATLSVNIDSLRPSKPSTEHSVQLHNCLLQTSQDLGITLNSHSSFGVSDANFIAATGIPVLDTIGAIGHGMHTTNETIQLDSLISRSHLLVTFLENYLQK